MNAWLLPIEAWLVDFAWLVTACWPTALLMRLMHARGGQPGDVGLGGPVGNRPRAVLDRNARMARYEVARLLTHVAVADSMRSCLKTISRACNRFY